MFFHEFSEHLVFALDLCFERGNFLVFGIFEGFGFSAIIEAEVSIFEELPLPLIEEGGADVEFIAEFGDWGAFEQMAFDDVHLFVGLKMTLKTFVGHNDTSVQVMLTRSEISSRSD